MCQYLAALCSIKLEKYSDALQILGEPLAEVKGLTEEQRKFESSLCYLRGVVYGKMSDGDRAKQSHVAAVKLDVGCYESFNVLVSNHMLTAEEGGLAISV
jgi:anaphase-promoting complex subunit 6